MKLDQLINTAKDSASARRVYAEPFEKDGTTVIPAATVAGGGGGGDGRDRKGQEGEGGGFGLVARPTGAYVINKKGRVRWVPAVDVNRLVATAGAIFVASLLVGARIVRIRTRGASAGGCSCD